MENEIALLKAKFAREEDEMKDRHRTGGIPREGSPRPRMKEIAIQRKADR